MGNTSANLPGHVSTDDSYRYFLKCMQEAHNPRQNISKAYKTKASPSGGTRNNRMFREEGKKDDSEGKVQVLRKKVSRTVILRKKIPRENSMSCKIDIGFHTGMKEVVQFLCILRSETQRCCTILA